MNVTLSLDQTAKILKISPATVKNWLRAGVLKSTAMAHVTETKIKIANGSLKRLQKGANKHFSQKVHPHNELLANPGNAIVLKPLMEKYAKKKKQLLFAVYLRQLVNAGFVKVNKKRFLANARLRTELSHWKINLNSKSFLQTYAEVSQINLNLPDNLLSFLHQSVSETSSKQDLGAYYTPTSAVKKALSSLNIPGTVCDPCCGSGNFLTDAFLEMKTRGWPSPETSVFGYDCDPLAVLIARANLTLVSDNKIDVMKAVMLQDFVGNPPAADFTYFVTNPPWGSQPASGTARKLQKKFGLKRTKDSFSFFLLTALELLEQNGSGSFILPVSFLNVAAHTEIRRWLLSKSTVSSVKVLDEKFSGVMTKAVLVSLSNVPPVANHEVLITTGAKSCKVPVRQILATETAAFPVYNDNESLNVLREIESSSPATLAGQSIWGLGLVTGNNEKYLFESAGVNRTPVITGSEVLRFAQPKARVFCHAGISDFQQAAPLKVYHAKKKLVYRFIAKELVFTIDTKKLLTLNSANILIPADGPYSCEFLCGLFNSKPAQYYFSKKYSSIKVLRSHLEAFPLPPFNEQIFPQVEASVMKLQRSYDKKSAERLDSLIVKAYGLSESSAKAVLSYELSGAFLP